MKFRSRVAEELIDLRPFRDHTTQTQGPQDALTSVLVVGEQRVVGYLLVLLEQERPILEDVSGGRTDRERIAWGGKSNVRHSALHDTPSVIPTASDTIRSPLEDAHGAALSPALKSGHQASNACTRDEDGDAVRRLALDLIRVHVGACSCSVRERDRNGITWK